MKSIIEKGLLLLLINLVQLTPVLSQTTLDSIQSKTLCLILNEHEKLSIENPLLKQQISALEQINELHIKSDSIQKIEIETYKNTINSNEEKLKEAEKRIFYTSLGGVLLFIIGLIL